MTPKFSAASKLAMLLAATALVAVSATSASAQSRPKYDKDGRIVYGAQGPNRSYQQGPHTRVYVTTRSWLDAGTEVLPGDRHIRFAVILAAADITLLGQLGHTASQ